jgi:hypothetical protein
MLYSGHDDGMQGSTLNVAQRSRGLLNYYERAKPRGVTIA